MFIINLTYKAELDVVESFLKQHIDFLDEQYARGNFLASGRKVPRTGGVILSNIASQAALEQIIAQDPFKQNDVADYELIEFIPTKTSSQLAFLMA